VLRADVPDGIFTLGVEADDAGAAAEHAAFADQCLPALLALPDNEGADRGGLRAAVVAQLAGLRRTVRDQGIGYLGAFAGRVEDRLTLVLLAVASSTVEFPPQIDPASVLAVMAREECPEADVEEFDTPAGRAVGLRRVEPLRGLPEGQQRIAGVAQALVPFPQAGLLGAVVGYTYTGQDVDVAAAITAVMACRMRAVAAEPAAPELLTTP